MGPKQSESNVQSALPPQPLDEAAARIEAQRVVLSTRLDALNPDYSNFTQQRDLG